MEWWIAVSELVRNFGLLGAAVVGVVLAGFRVVAANRQADAALRQAELARRDHVAELFNRAVGQLDDEKLQVRLGAIYTLGQIARDFPDLTDAVSDLLSVYARHSTLDYGEGEPPVDIREIMRILQARLSGNR
jgi:HEAT repeat protein